MGLLKYKLRDGWHVLYGGILQKVLRKDMNLSDVDNVASARSNLGLTGNVTTHYHQVYVDSIADLQSQIDVLTAAKQDLYNKYNNLLGRIDIAEGDIANLKTRVSALETTVGDANSGLVKDVNTLKSVVGNASSGLVKQVNTNTSDIADLKAIDAGTRLTNLENTINNSTTGLQKRITDLENLPRVYISGSAPSNVSNDKALWVNNSANNEAIKIRTSNNWKTVGAFWK